MFVLQVASPNSPFILRSVWDDNLGFQESGILFNPFYSPRGAKTPLPVKASMPYLELWKQCYFRHNEILDIVGGGNIQVCVYLFNTLVGNCCGFTTVVFLHSSVLSIHSKCIRIHYSLTMKLRFTRLMSQS